MPQSVRRSQFITTYGPGAILEGQGGPRVVLSVEGSGILNGRRITDFEITDQRLSQVLLAGAGIVRIPSNSEVGVPERTAIYRTDRFPSWSLCVRHEDHVLYRKTEADDRACPRCPPLPTIGLAWERSNLEAIRFILACSAGHMDDVNWVGLIRHTTAGCRPDYLLWEGSGGALRHIQIRCPECRQSENLGSAYARDWPCRGRFPELRREVGCATGRAKIIQRGAANLRMAELVTALTIPPRVSPVHRILEGGLARGVIIAGRITTKAALVAALAPLVAQGLFKRTALEVIERNSDQDVDAAILDVAAPLAAGTVDDLKAEEFDRLQAAARDGAPIRPPTVPGEAPGFEVIRDDVRRIPAGIVLRVAPVSRLRVVMVQRGYRRLDPGNDLVDRRFAHEERDWYPGVELYGEGVFIDVDPDSEGGSDRTLLGEHAGRWYDAWIASLGSEPDDELHPTFVWWHSLAHRLIAALALDSGYSSASIRERVFVRADPVTGAASGGVLLYTAQPGGDGTLGGLVATVPDFERILDTATMDLDACSNDPLCDEESFTAGRANGAACYACLLISETSCEHRNTRLDRHVLIDNPLRVAP